MDEIIYQKSYQEYKAELDGELQKTAEGFVKIGYLLKVARDTNVLSESGYKTVAEFAEAEYNLNKTQVSRFMSINDKFSEGGYSEKLMDAYKGYGYAKLTIMLQLPDAINEELTPNFSKAEIQAIREEVAEEQEVSDIERMIEEPNEHEENLQVEGTLYQAILQLGEDDPELYAKISEKKRENLQKILPEIMAPAGDKMYSVRVRGVGRLMISISELSDTVKVINSRSGEKESYTWEEMENAWIHAGVLGLADQEQTPIECWEQRYERKWPIAPKIAPVQQPVKKEAKKETKVKKASKDWPSKYKKGQQVKVLKNDNIGELVGKTDKSGKWKVKFPTYSAELKEKEFTEYIEEVQLNDYSEEIPKVEESKETVLQTPVNQIESEQAENPEEAIQGQMNVEDYPEMMPEGLDMMQTIMIDKAERLIRRIKAREWDMAKMDIEMLEEDIKRAKIIDEMEEEDE